jgi:hypothetical protein
MEVGTLLEVLVCTQHVVMASVGDHKQALEGWVCLPQLALQ